MNKRIFLLIKVFDKEEYADAFIQKGEMFCKTLGQFKKIEGDAARGDQFEAPSDWHQPDRISVSFSVKTPEGLEKHFPIEGLAGPLVVQRTALDRLNVFCMYALTVPEFEESYETEEERLHAVSKINALLKEHATLSDEINLFGEYAVVITNVKDFITKVTEAARQGGYSLKRGLVDYFDPENFHGSFEEIESAFKKRQIYSYQKEFRFVFDSQRPPEAQTIHAGSLEGLAVKLKTNEINDRLELKVRENRLAGGGAA